MGKAKRSKGRQAQPGERRAAILHAVKELEKASGEAVLSAMMVIAGTAADARSEVNPPDVVFGCGDPVVERLTKIASDLDEAAAALKKES